VRDAELEIFLFEFHDHVDRYLAGVDGGPHSLEELIAYNEANAREVLPLFGQELFLEAQKRGSLDHPDYRAALAKTAELRDALGRLFVDQRLDALVVPANAPAWRDAAGPRAFVGTAWLAAVSGFPNVVVPAMLAEELPIGVSFIGPPRQEALLLDVAALFERARGEFPAPRFLPSIGD
jgi:amidase